MNKIKIDDLVVRAPFLTVVRASLVDPLKTQTLIHVIMYKGHFKPVLQFKLGPLRIDTSKSP
jgi:hypothetical protein